MMIGMAGESFDSALRSAEQIGALAPDFVRIYPMLVLRDSALERWHARGRYQPLTLTEAVSRTKALLQLFTSLDIPVIRMGLQATEELNPQAAVVAGPFHPAFGELVRAAVWRDFLEDCLLQCDGLYGRVTIKVNPHHLSQAKGHQNSNINCLHQRFNSLKIDICADNAIAMDRVEINNHHFTLNTGIGHAHQSRTGKASGSG